MQATHLPPISFDELSEHLRNNGYAVVDGFVPLNDVFDILSDLRNEEEDFHKAGVGQAADYQVIHTLRGDYIKWLDVATAGMATRMYLERIEALRIHLNRRCFLGLQDYEVHFTRYPIGTRYAKHVDAFSNDDNRCLSIVLYLNPSWKPGDGGELHLYPTQMDDAMHVVEPLAGRLVIFESTLEHEVVPARIERHSVTGWMLKEKRFF